MITGARSYLAAGGAGEAPYLPDTLFHLLQSLAISTEQRDLDGVRTVQGQLWNVLSPAQNDLVCRIELLLRE